MIARTRKHKNAFVGNLAVKTLALLDENKNTAKAKGYSKDAKTNKKSGDHISYNKADNTTS